MSFVHYGNHTGIMNFNNPGKVEMHGHHRPDFYSLSQAHLAGLGKEKMRHRAKRALSIPPSDRFAQRLISSLPKLYPKPARRACTQAKFYNVFFVHQTYHWIYIYDICFSTLPL